MVIKINKCPYCNSTNIAPLKTPEDNQSYALAIIDKNSNSIPQTYVKLSIIGCRDCKGLIITSPYLY
jgi:hypothetical protein